MNMQFNSTFKLSVQRETQLWMVDIVSFSQILDPLAQEEVINNLFSAVYSSMEKLSKIISNDEQKRNDLSSDDATVIWTGDGAIVAMKAPFELHSPIILSYIFENIWMNEIDWTRFKCCQSNNHSPKVHIAIHSGLCRWLHTPTLRSPLFEVSNCFGVPINELARICSFSTAHGDFVATDEYANKLLSEKDSLTIEIKIEKSTVKVNFSEPLIGQVSGKEKKDYHYRFFKF